MANTDTYEWRLVGTTLAASATDKILPVITSNFQFVLNEGTGGAITIPLDCSAASTITEGMLVVLYYRGAIRESFLVENIRKVPGQEGAKEVLSVSGRGGMTVLDRAIIWGDGTTSTTRTFTTVTKASILVTLVTEAQARGGLSTLTLDFDATNDSDSIAWTDSETYKLNVGTSLLDLVRQFAKTGIDFEVTYSGTGFVLSAYKNGIGTDKSETVFFRTGTNCQEIDIDQRGNDIKNALLVAYQAGQIVVSDSASITANGRREDLLDARLAQTAASATTYGAAILDTEKDTKIGRTINVYDGVPPYLFVNYILGDTVTLDIEGTETTDRILGIQCNFENGEYSNIVIELNSLMLEQNLKMQQDIDYLLNNWQTAHDAGLLEVSYWAAIGGSDNVITSIWAIHVANNKIYVGGSFTRIGGVNTNSFAIYDVLTGLWSGTDAVSTATVTSITSVSTDIYFCSSRFVYKYDGSTVTAVGELRAYSPDEFASMVIAVHAVGTDVYATGWFDEDYGGTAIDLANAAVYDTTLGTWAALADSLGVRCGSIINIGSDIYFGSASFVAAGQVHKYSSSVFSQVGGDFDGEVRTLAAYGTNVLAGGGFTGNLSEWNGSAWATFGGGVGDVVRGLAVYLTDVYAVGDFIDVGNHIAKYSGGTWWELGTGLNNSGYAVAMSGDDVVAGGIFTEADGKPAEKIAMYFTNFESLMDYLENAGSSFNMGAAIHNAAASAISDSDEVPFWEDAANALRKITWANIKATLKTYFDTLYVALTGNQTIAGVKTFSSDPIIPDEAYDATAWNGVLEPPTKNAMRDKIETMGLPAGSDTQVQFNDGGAFSADAGFVYDKTQNTITLGDVDSSIPTSAAPGGLLQGANAVSVANVLETFGTGVASFITFLRGRGTNAAPTAVQADDVLGRIRGRGYDSNGGSSTTSTEIRLLANETHTTTAHGTRVEIYTTPNGSTTLTKAFTINADGTVNIESGKTYNINGMPLAAGDGWIVASGWSYASASTINVPSGAIFDKGDKIYITTSTPTTRQFYVVGISGNVLTLLGHTSGVENATFATMKYSKVATPNGFPDWFAYQPTYTNCTETTLTYSRFRISGSMLFWEYFGTLAMTSTTSAKISFPVAPTYDSAFNVPSSIAGAYDIGFAQFYIGGGTFNIWKDPAATNFTSGTSPTIIFTIMYGY